MDPCLLFIFAHPDDESFSGVGTAMEYAARGARIALVTATRGERGKQGDPPICTPDELPAVRERELRQAATIAGFDELHVLDYRDRELADAPLDEIRRTLVSHIRRLRPSAVLRRVPGWPAVPREHVRRGAYRRCDHAGGQLAGGIEEVTARVRRLSAPRALCRPPTRDVESRAT